MFGEGSLIQLYSKGPQDVYLTSGVEKYIPEYVFGMSIKDEQLLSLKGLYPTSYPWNVPTQIQANYDPRNGYYPIGVPTYPILTRY